MSRRTGWNHIARNLTLLSQFGLSLVMPTLLCLGACYYLTCRFAIGMWIYIPGFILGLGGSCVTAYRFGRSAMHHDAPDDHKDVAFNKHR